MRCMRHLTSRTVTLDLGKRHRRDPRGESWETIVDVEIIPSDIERALW